MQESRLKQVSFACVECLMLVVAQQGVPKLAWLSLLKFEQPAMCASTCKQSHVSDQAQYECMYYTRWQVL